MSNDRKKGRSHRERAMVVMCLPSKIPDFWTIHNLSTPYPFRVLSNYLLAIHLPCIVSASPSQLMGFFHSRPTTWSPLDTSLSSRYLQPEEGKKALAKNRLRVNAVNQPDTLPSRLRFCKRHISTKATSSNTTSLVCLRIKPRNAVNLPLRHYATTKASKRPIHLTGG